MFLSNYSNEYCHGYDIRYNSGVNKGAINTRRFINTLDFSKDLIKLPEIYEKVYRRSDFTFEIRGKEYCRRVLNVTFKYSVKEYNCFFNKVYIKFGYLPEDITLRDGICLIDGKLAAIQVDVPVESEISQEILGDYFCYKDGCYRTSGKAIRVLYTVAQLRDKLYADGFICDKIKFCRFKRSSGSSRVGKCLFIDEKLYRRIHKWEMCGLKVREGEEVDLAALEAYIALTLSSIIGTITIKPENFLVIDDYKSVFKDKVIAVRADENGKLVSRPEDVDVSNSIWDGQSLIDKSLMGEYQDKGMVLLRNRFFKSACFNCNLQEFFRENNITNVTQLKGKTIAKNLSDIKIITTPSSIKYCKFGSIKQWLDCLNAEGEFGVVKHEKPTHFFDGEMVQIHYQLLNTLQMNQEEINELVKPSLEYLSLIQNEPSAMRYHLKYGSINDQIEEITSTNDIIYKMLGISDKFSQTKLYYDFTSDISQSFRKNLRKGHLLVRGNYSTLLGNPVEMLYESIGRFDGKSMIGEGNVFSKHFADNQTILGSRSPHVTMGNVWLTHNTYNSDIQKYFNITDEIICINSINENVLMRLSGADFDSDTVLLTDNPILISAAQRNYDKFLVPTSLVEAKKVVRKYTKAEQSDLDIKTSVNKIGEIVNLSQELNTKLWDMMNSGASYEDVEELYCDIAKLDVLSGLEIDKAKKEFAVDSVAELRTLKKKYEERDEIGRQIKPNFFGKIAKMKGYYDSEHKNYKFHDTSMDYLQHSLNNSRSVKYKWKTIPFSEMLQKDANCTNQIKYPQVKKILGMVRDMKSQIQAIWHDADSGMTNQEKVILTSQIREECNCAIKNMQLNPNTAHKLLLAIEEPKNRDISRSLFLLLFSTPNESFLRFVESHKEDVMTLEQCDDGDIKIYDMMFRKVPLYSEE